MTRVYIYKRFERFWHWCQAVLVIFMAVTGFEIHGTYELFGFEKAVSFHRIAAYLLLVLIAFAIFWHFTTDGWRHYIPTRRNFIAQVRFYMFGIFKGEPHPTAETELSKLNPLQRLVYLGLKLVIIPILVISGLLYMYYSTLGNYLELLDKIGLESIALWHTLGAFLMMSFLVVHIYMTTTGHTPLSNIKAMLTGYEEIEPENKKEEDTK
ncbi:MAG: cytochrome B [Candidatus Zixiibacteriota bacterium]|nr:MAG: cytochrome B [candidate division Zixibacteria bacterium]HHI03338.1 cytochrome B [candidate division Zixibacteria bacterium]